MEWLFIFGLAGVAAYLWNRLDRAERRLDQLDRLQEATLVRLQRLVAGDREAAPEDEAIETSQPESPASAPPPVSVPKTAPEREPAVLRVSSPSAESQPTSEAYPAGPDDESVSKSRFALPNIRFDFEDIFGRRLPIWGGGVALAVAGVFLVRYAIEAGLLTPSVRVAMAFLFGVALLAGAEVARRFEHKVADERVQQALAGAGLATLYAGFYLAGSQYGLIGQLVAFVGLAAVTAAAIALSFRFGLPSAVLGLVGGFAAPALVGGDGANVPLLALYLGLVTAGLAFSGERQKRPWMGIAALVGGLGWGALLLAAGDFDRADILALGLYFLVLGVVLPAFIASERFERLLRLGSAAVASLQLALLVDAGGYSPLAWALYLLLGATIGFFGWRRSELREASAIAATIGLLLVAQWPHPESFPFALVATGFAAVFAGLPLVHLTRSDEQPTDILQLALVPPALMLVVYGQLGSFEDRAEPTLALASLALGLLPLVGAWLAQERLQSRFFAGLVGAGLALLFAAILLVTPAWSAPLATLPSLATIAWLLHRRTGSTLANLLWIGATVTALALMTTPDFFDEIGKLAGDTGGTTPIRALLRWLAAAAPLAGLAWFETRLPAKRAAEGLAALATYSALAQILPADALAWTAALLAIVLVQLQPARIASQAVLAAIAVLWALPEFGEWLEAGLASLQSDPVFANDLPDAKAVLLHLLPAVTALWLLRIDSAYNLRLRHATRIAAGVLAIIAAHILFKQAFGIETVTRFVTHAVAERTLWQALLLAAAWLAARGVPQLGSSRWIAIGLASLSLGHFLLYTGLIHNPLWDRQALGPAPIANLALAAYAVAIAAALSLRVWLIRRHRPWIDGLVIFLTSLGTLTLLRQAFGGAIPVDAPMTQAEDLLRSLLGIMLAFAFLFVGARRKERSWRVGSLVLMLIAVAKVFIYDAAGLEGLLRISSFMALGFSLIGIGWVYSKQLKAAPAATE